MMLKRLLLSIGFFTVCLAAGHLIQSEPSIPLENRFYKVSNDGQLITAWKGPWACVYDEKENLLWEVKRDDESIMMVTGVIRGSTTKLA